MCNQCQQSICSCQQQNICQTCPPEPCACPIPDLSTNCIILGTTEPLSCSGIEPGTILTEAIEQFDEYICEAISQINASINLTNLGGGTEIYKGIDNLGKRQLRTITSEDDSVTITQNPDTIDLAVVSGALQGLQSVLDVDPEATLGIESSGKSIYRMTNDGFETSYSRIRSGSQFDFATLRIGNGVGIFDSGATDGLAGQVRIDSGVLILRQRINNTFTNEVNFEPPTVNTVTRVRAKGSAGTYYFATEDMIPVVDGSETKLTAGTKVSITGTGTISTPYTINAIIDGSETKINAGTNVTLTGNGTIATPYIINSTSGGDGSETKVTAGTNISVTGNGTIATPYIINNSLIVDGSETKLNPGITTTVTGNGTIGTPYTVETVNLQKAITTNYTLLTTDDNYSIKINNGATPITITVPTGLPVNFFVGLTQKGSGDVTLLGSSTTIGNPVGLKIKGQGYHVGLEQIGSSNVFDLLGFTKA